MTTYITAAELKATLGVGSIYADADVTVAIEAASRACDGYKDTRFWATTETRYYTGCPGEYELDIDDISTISSVTIDQDGNGSFETTWTNGTDFYAHPVNAALDAAPYRKLVLLPQAGKRFPPWPNAVKITGSFGWSTTPGGVKQATSIYAARLLKRARETPNGIQVVAGEAVAAARLGRIDPDVAFLLDNLPAEVPILAI